MWLLVVERLVMDFFLHLVYFPLWWYTAGALYVGRRLWEWIRIVNEYLAPGLWIRHLFVPMFGQHDWQGRIVSFFLRLMNSIVRSIALCIWLLVVCIIYIAWFIVPIGVVYMLGGAIVDVFTLRERSL